MAGPRRETGVAWRLFVTVWLVYSVFATTNVVRETYLAITLGSRASVRVDMYQDLHPDLFEMPGRGWYINSNPGASIIAALPYGLLVRPAIALATKIWPGIAEPRPPATYDDPRPNRTRFLNAARARGLDIVLGLAAIGTAVTVMAPLGALAAMLVFLYLRSRLDSPRHALILSLVFAFATPMLFRAAFLNQNALVANLVLFAWILMTGLAPRSSAAGPGARALFAIGLLLGFALVTDFSAVPFAVVFGIWILSAGWRRGGLSRAMSEATPFALGAATTMSVLFLYQWAAFGHPLWPAQSYMPPTEFSVRGWFGFSVPAADLVWANLFDPRYGLFVFCPFLVLGVAYPLFANRFGTWAPSRSEAMWIGLAVAGLLLFNSANLFSHLQFNTGVRYMVPAVPLLFLASVPALLAAPKAVTWPLVGASLLISAAVTMTREDVPTALRLLFTEGPALPVLTVLRKTASGYAVQLPPASAWLVMFAIAGTLVLLWRPILRRPPWR